MEKVLSWFETHPLVRLILLLGGVGGAVALAVSVLQSSEDPVVNEGPHFFTVCTNLWQTSCAAENAAFLKALEGVSIGETVRLNLEVYHGPFDIREDACPNASSLGAVPDRYLTPDTATILTLPTSADACEEDTFFSISDFDARLVDQDEGTVHRIDGIYEMTSQDLEVPDIGEVAWSWVRVFTRTGNSDAHVTELARPD